MQHKWDTNDTSAAWVILICDCDFDNDMSENIFSDPYIRRLQGEEEFHFKNYLLEMPHSYGKMHLKSDPQKLN